MDELILALQLIQSKMIGNVSHPTNCDHDEFRVYAGVEKTDFTDAELAQLDKWGFEWDDEFDGFLSGRFGSC